MTTWCRNSAASEIPYSGRVGPGRAEERPAGEVTVPGGEPGEVLHERGREVVPPRVPSNTADVTNPAVRGSRLEEGEDARADVAAVPPGPGRRGARQDVEVVGTRRR